MNSHLRILLTNFITKSTTMSAIIKMTDVPLSSAMAFNKFINELQMWWPKEYTWSKDKLVLLKMGNNVNELCSEIGPDNFHCDWGKILEIEQGKKIKFSWQIDYNRVPQPDPAKASEVEVTFENAGAANCSVKIIHRNLDKHEIKQHLYFEALNGQHGWDYILGCFTDYCTN